MGPDRLSDQLAACPLFGGLNAECCKNFSAQMELCEFETGDIVYNEGDLASHLFVVRSGHFEVVKTSRPDAPIFSELKPGDFFGDMSFIDMQPRSATVRAPEGGSLWRMHYSVLRRAYEHDLKCYTLVVMNIAREMSRRLRRADRRNDRYLAPANGRRSRHTMLGIIEEIGMRHATPPDGVPAMLAMPRVGNLND